MKSKLTNRVAALEARAKHVEQRRNPPKLTVRFGEIFPLQDKPAHPRPPSPYPPDLEVRFVQPKAQRGSSKGRRRKAK